MASAKARSHQDDGANTRESYFHNSIGFTSPTTPKSLADV